MKTQLKALFFLFPLSFVGCFTDGGSSSGGQIDVSAMKGVTIVSQEVVDGETRSLHLISEVNLLELNEEEGIAILQNPGYSCAYKEDPESDDASYTWELNTLDTVKYVHQGDSLVWGWREYTGGPEFYGKWTTVDGESNKSTMTIASDKIINDMNLTYDCWAEGRSYGENSKQISCSTLEVYTLPEKLTLRHYYDAQLNEHDVWIYGSKSCERIRPAPLNESQCGSLDDALNSIDPCRELNIEISNLYGVNYISICKLDEVLNDGYCNNECVNFKDPDCD